MMPAERRAKSTHQISAGGIIYRRLDDRIMVCLIKTSPEGQWRLPKGLVEEKESLEAAALREVQEETGLKGCPQGLIDTIEYRFRMPGGADKILYHKLVYFYLIKYTGGRTDNHDHEVEEARWMSPDEAMRRLTFASEKKIMARGMEMIALTGAGL